MSVVDDIKSRLDIVETVSSYVALKKSGKYLKANCPFHSEKTPSFIVSQEKQNWRCFGACATGGDVLSFVSQAERLDFGDTIRLLAEKTGVELRRDSNQGRSEVLYRVNRLAVEFYADALQSNEGHAARKYLEQRGVSDAIRKKFELGFSPRKNDAIKTHLNNLGVSEQEEVMSGILYQDDSGKTRDFFRGRLMFPIHDVRGRPVGFGARALDDSNPKYLNTAATSIFDKRRISYGIHIAADHIRKENRGIIVEGYMDTIAAHQFGYSNVVASMGTALTEEQVAQLKPMASSFVLALDPDAAGQEATLRSLESAWHQIGTARSAAMNSSVGVLHVKDPLSLFIASLPEGKDPDTLIRLDDREWNRLISEASPLLEYLIPVLTSRFDLNSGHGKARAIEIIAPLIASTEPIEQDSYITKLAKAISADEKAVKANIRALLKRGTATRKKPGNNSANNVMGKASLGKRSEDYLEGYVLGLLMKRPELRDRTVDFSPENFHQSDHRELFTLSQTCSTMEEMESSLDESLRQRLGEILGSDWVSGDILEGELALDQCLKRLELRHLQELQESLLASSVVGDPPPMEIQSAISQVNSRLKELFSSN